jgi:hypothetical protein
MERIEDEVVARANGNVELLNRGERLPQLFAEAGRCGAERRQHLLFAGASCCSRAITSPDSALIASRATT